MMRGSVAAAAAAETKRWTDNPIGRKWPNTKAHVIAVRFEESSAPIFRHLNGMFVPARAHSAVVMARAV